MICFGLEESQKNSAEEMRRDDEDRVNDLFREILQVAGMAFNERPVRLGRYDADKKRLVKLVFDRF